MLIRRLSQNYEIKLSYNLRFFLIILVWSNMTDVVFLCRRFQVLQKCKKKKKKIRIMKSVKLCSDNKQTLIYNYNFTVY